MLLFQIPKVFADTNNDNFSGQGPYYTAIGSFTETGGTTSTSVNFTLSLIPPTWSPDYDEYFGNATISQAIDEDNGCLVGHGIAIDPVWVGFYPKTGQFWLSIQTPDPSSFPNAGRCGSQSIDFRTFYFLGTTIINGHGTYNGPDYYGGQNSYEVTLTANSSTNPSATQCTPSEITINFGPNAKQEVVSDYSKKVIKDLLHKAGIDSATIVITSTARTPEDQARIMFNILNSQGRGGLPHYFPPGEQVIDLYYSEKDAGYSDDQIKSDMTALIKQFADNGEWHGHLSDPSITDVIDISPKSLGSEENQNAFENAAEEAKQSGELSKFFGPSDRDQADHLEIPQNQGDKTSGSTGNEQPCR